MSQTHMLITGAGTGIGRALAHHAADQGMQVLGVGRRIAKLEEMQAYAPTNIQVLAADITLAEDRQRIADMLKEKTLKYLVHNAAILEPVAAFENIQTEAWQRHMEINVNAPLYLTQKLLPYFSNGARILSISSGAAHKAYPGWTTYCTSKAALLMLTSCMDKELKAHGIRAGSAAPGVVDTPMQDQVRLSDPDAFPDLQRFLDLKTHNKLTAPEETAAYLWWLLSEVPAETFATTAWDIRKHWKA